MNRRTTQINGKGGYETTRIARSPGADVGPLVALIFREDPPRWTTAFPWPPWRLIYGAAIRNHRKRLKTWHRRPLRSTVKGGNRKADLPGTQTPRDTISNCVPAKCVKLEGQFNLGDIHDTRLHGAV